MSLGFESLMVLAPHADDETLGCGGLLARAKREGGIHTTVLVLVLQEGREEELHAACDRLRVDNVQVVFRADRVPYADDRAIDAVDAVVQELRPDALALPFVGALHQEHRAASAIGMSVVRPLALQHRFRPRIVLQYEEVADAWSTSPSARPSLLLQMLDADMDAKVEAMACHDSQLGVLHGVRSERSIRALAALRGAQAGVPWAEAYQPLLEVR